jgi:hypothetical protein
MTARYAVGDRVHVPGGGLGSDPHAVYTVADVVLNVGLSTTGGVYYYQLVELSPSFGFREDFLEPETPPEAMRQLALPL